jgi:hypothetical protein
MKVTTIEEAQDLSSIKVYELIGSLQTFNMSICDKLEKKTKAWTLYLKKTTKTIYQMQ